VTRRSPEFASKKLAEPSITGFNAVIQWSWSRIGSTSRLTRFVAGTVCEVRSWSPDEPLLFTLLLRAELIHTPPVPIPGGPPDARRRGL